jgi:hypothetical protein
VIASAVAFPPTVNSEIDAGRVGWRRSRSEADISSIGVVFFRMTYLILIIDLEFLGGFSTLVNRADRCLILIRMLIVSVIVVIFGATHRVRGENQSLKLPRRA